VSDPAPRRELTPLGVLLLLAVHGFGALLLLYLGNVASGDEEAVPSAVFILGAILAATLIALYVGLTRYAPDEPTAVALRVERPDRPTLGLVALSALFGLLAAPALLDLTMAALEAMSKEEVAAQTPSFDTPYADVLLVVILVLLPIVVELLYRGLVQPRLIARMGVWRGIAATLMFSWASTAVTQSPGVVLLYLPMGMVAHASGTTWASIATVLAALGGAVGVSWLFGDPPWWMVLPWTGAALGVLAIIWRARRPPR
jgi:membrane protease YdiL (CAAX protease family)